MKIKYEINADENGWTETVTKDGKIIAEQKHEMTNGGAKMVSGKSYEDVTEISDEVYSEIENFIGFNLAKYCVENEEIEE